MNTSTETIPDSDELLALVSALAQAHNVSECDITPDDIEEFCQHIGWGHETF